MRVREMCEARCRRFEHLQSKRRAGILHTAAVGLLLLLPVIYNPTCSLLFHLSFTLRLPRDDRIGEELISNVIGIQCSALSNEPALCFAA